MLGHRFNSMLAASTLALMLFAPALLSAADVKDDAGFFSATAVDKANQSIRDIEKRTGHDIRIETYSSVPAGKAEAYKKMSKDEQHKFMNQWVHDRAREVKEYGTLIIVCKSPGHVESYYHKKMADAGMTKSDLDDVNKAMLDGMGAKEYDHALSETVSKLDSVYSKLKKSSDVALSPQHDYSRLNHPQGHPNPAPVQHEPPVVQQRAPAKSSWAPVLFILFIVVGGIFVISLISRLMGGGNRGYGQPGYGPPPGYGPSGNGGGYGGGGGGGGGGFMRGLAGGIFGAMAGNWLYDSFGGSRSAHGQDYSPHSGNDPLSGSRTLGDDSNTGGGWSDEGSSSGGGWFGGDSGGDSGGGDFGSGGGGGDFGGGGGGGGGDSGGGDF